MWMIRSLRTIWRDVLLNVVISSVLVPRPLRWRLLRLAGLDASPSEISPRCFFGGTNISIGEGTFVNYGVFFDNSAAITIGSKCQIGMGVTLCTSSHDIGPSEQRGGPHAPAPITVGDGTWIGAGVMVLPGAFIAPGCVIAAGSVVRGDLAADGFYAGVPAVRKSELPVS